MTCNIYSSEWLNSNNNYMITKRFLIKFLYKFCSDDAVSMRKSPKQNFSSTFCKAGEEKRSYTPDFEQQQPCTSKQSNTPEKSNKSSTADTAVLPSSSSSSSYSSSSSSSSASPLKSSTSPASKHNYSSFYQELLEASYANDGE